MILLRLTEWDDDTIDIVFETTTSTLTASNVGGDGDVTIILPEGEKKRIRRPFALTRP